MPPEGLSEAEQAFHQQIAPAVADRSRDADTGRFVATQKPEPMFEPRPVEGDPKTGDTRDAGDDPRFSAIERRIADGRAEEDDDEQRFGVQDDAPRSRSADGDGKHPAERAEEQKRGGEQELADQDGEKPDGGTAAEGEPKPDAEGPRYEVNVDGQVQEVTLGEALKGYIREATFHQRMSQVDLARQQVQQAAQNVESSRDAYQQKLQFADRLLAELTPPEPDWNQEAAIDPRAAWQRKMAYEAIHQKRAMLADEYQKSANEARAEYDRQAHHYAISQFSEFVHEADFKDEKTLNDALHLMRNYLRKEGFNEGEVAQVYDKRMMKVAHKAALWDQSQAEIPKPVAPGQGKTLTPGRATPIGNAPRRHIDEAQNRLAKSGKLEDAAALFQRLLR